MNKKILALLAAISTVTLLGASCGKNSTLFGRNNNPADPAISVVNQNLSDSNEVVIAKASIPENGWITIHTKKDGQASDVIGYTAFETGTDTNIKVTVDRSQVTPSLIAMLHYDRGSKGTYEFPGTDGPVIKDQKVIMQEFTLLNQGEIEKQNAETTPAATTGARKEFVITAKQWSFSPAIIKVKKGDTVVLKATSVDVTHGLNLREFGVNETLEPNKTKTIEFVADKTGTFTFSCSVACGAGHKAMTGTLVVE